MTGPTRYLFIYVPVNYYWIMKIIYFILSMMTNKLDRNVLCENWFILSMVLPTATKDLDYWFFFICLLVFVHVRMANEFNEFSFDCFPEWFLFAQENRREAAMRGDCATATHTHTHSWFIFINMINIFWSRLLYYFFPHRCVRSKSVGRICSAAILFSSSSSFSHFNYTLILFSFFCWFRCRDVCSSWRKVKIP